MRKFLIEIECENDAFQPSVTREISTLLLDVIVDLRRKVLTNRVDGGVPILDTNGNKVGFARFVDSIEVPDDTPPGELNEIERTMVRVNRDLIGAIRGVRDRLHLGLREAKALVDAYAASLKPETTHE